ncbi:MAG: hypothetical protein AB8G23_24760 [Myxococcota bacterium]
MRSISEPARGRCSRLLAAVGLIAFVSLFGASGVFAQVEFIEWSSVDAGSGGGITASPTYSINAGTVTSGVTVFSDPLFIAEYSNMVPFISYASSSLPADIGSTIGFSAPLPLGSVLLVFDVDVNQETFILESEGVALKLLDQIESTLGAESVFPTYDTISGELVAPGVSNLSEMSIFDLAGANSIDVAFLNGQSGSGGGIAIAVPEPRVPIQLCFGSAGLLLAFRNRAAQRKSARANSAPPVLI